ncbi:MAG: hypothetical protein Q9160_008800 [Pyrenula sp. 1 TL-2023]
MAVTRSGRTTLNTRPIRSRNVFRASPKPQLSLPSVRLRARRTTSGASAPANQIHPDIETSDNQVSNNPAGPPSGMARKSHAAGDVADQSYIMESGAGNNHIGDLDELVSQDSSSDSDSGKGHKVETQCSCSSFIGIPENGRWHVKDVYNTRWSYENNQTEYLVELCNSHIRPADFNKSGAEDLLRYRLMVYAQLKPEHRQRVLGDEANATDPLWRQCDRPLGLGPHGEDNIFLIRLKLVWMGKAHGIDEARAKETLRKRKEKAGIRFSQRSKNETFERIRKEKASVVANLVA